MQQTNNKSKEKKSSSPALPSLTLALDFGKSSDPLKIKEKVSFLNRTLYKSEIMHDTLIHLERSALRGEGIEKPEPKSPIRPPKKSNDLAEKLRAEHSPGFDGTQILKLPKMSYGRHKTYNEEPEFVNKHFVNKNRISLSPEHSKEYSELNRKFRAYKKKNDGNKITSPRNTQRWGSVDLEFYDMDSGFLVCNKEQHVVDSYENTRNQIKVIYQTFRNIDDERLEKKKWLERNRELRLKEAELMKRLHPTSRLDSDVSRVYITKYSPLFDHTESPQTTKPIIHKKFNFP
ncbi:unnamed protein product [Blepharisma stoltei]|uniref:Uncharacterized protein n=1 Tax=Blepharisma stoltei TaxID=1481888 RepID=A0AAU9J2W5_9CILI|nr:unnamed protein product [Blepharisma stoltei]